MFILQTRVKGRDMFAVRGVATWVLSHNETQATQFRKLTKADDARVKVEGEFGLRFSIAGWGGNGTDTLSKRGRK